MTSRTFFLLCLLVYVLAACAPQPHLRSDISDSKSELLNVSMKKTDFEVDASWDMEGISQSYETPTTDNHGLIESTSHRLIGTIGNNRLIALNHRLSKYGNKVDWIEPVSLIQEEGYQPTHVVFPSLGESMNYQCYTDSVLLTCDVVVQYGTLISKLGFQLPRSFIENDRIDFINSILLKIDARATQYK